MAKTDDGRTRIVLADDHAILRSGLKMLIGTQPDMVVVGEAARMSEVAAVIAEAKPHVLLLDIAMPGGTALQTLKEVVGNHAPTRVLILTMHRDIALVRSVLSAGACGFVLKQAADSDLLSAIRAVRQGGLFIDPTVARDLLPFPAPARTPSRNLLSDRELQVLKALAQGHTNQDVAARLSLSVKTVETYRTRIAEKLGLRSRREITRFALATGLLTAEDAFEERPGAA